MKAVVGADTWKQNYSGLNTEQVLEMVVMGQESQAWIKKGFDCQPQGRGLYLVCTWEQVRVNS